MNPTKQQLEDELSEVEISIDLYIKEIENLESHNESAKNAVRINACGEVLKDLYIQKRDLQGRIERMSNNE
ncbi:MAG: hypothetical protein E7558_00245 [Ruminococcaceae bacterium]|nr:hypothetical protein [Oscillospiraceae bacterium]